nr:bridging integrator 2-like [Procambarus clarkii]
MASDKQGNKSKLMQGLVLVGLFVPCIVVVVVVQPFHQPGLGLVALSVLLYFLVIVAWVIVRSCVGRCRVESDLERQSESSAGPEQVPGAPEVAKTPSYVLSPAPADHLSRPPPYEESSAGPEQVPGAPEVAKTPSYVLSSAPADHLSRPPPYEESSAGPEQVPGAPEVAKSPSNVLSPAPADHLSRPPPYETLHAGSSAPDGATVASESCERQCGGRCERQLYIFYIILSKQISHIISEHEP